jgi:uncharacterized membrane protein
MLLDGVTLARVIHVLALVHWIGGVAVVTTVVLPHAQTLKNAKEAIRHFEDFEQRFARQARISIFFAGASGLYMLIELHAWDRLQYLAFWWLDLMIAVWAAFAVMVYVLEPLFVHDAFRRFAERNKEQAFSLAKWLHFVALMLSLLAIAGGILGSHGALP